MEGGYSPSRVRLRAGEPSRLVFDRREDSGCSEEVVIPELGDPPVPARPPAHRRSISPAQRPGTYEFTCGMGMLRGSLVVEESVSVTRIATARRADGARREPCRDRRAGAA